MPPGADGCISNLKEQIQDSLIASISQRYFLSTHKLDEIFILPAIEGAVEELKCEPHDRIKLVDTIYREGRRVFAILLYRDLENHIVDFRKHSALDKRLPLSEAHMTAIVGPRIARQIAEDVQWMFCPYTFPENMSEYHHQIEQKMILPFIDTEQVGFGAFGYVDRMTIPPSQQNFGKGKEPVQIVRKWLKEKGNTEDFEREIRCLRLLNRLQHPNIIPLWGSYTYNGEQNFLFPYVETDLHSFLMAETRHKDFQWDFTFYSALTGLASALSKTHSFQLNQADHGLDLEAIGYHHDIRPRNVLVNHDTFILADFGLGNVKQAGDSSHTPYKWTCGDYVAPETTDMQGHPQASNRATDVWAFGCLVAEVVTYMLTGKDGIEEFRRNRLTPGRFPRSKDSSFYQPDGKVKQEVTEWMETLKRDNTRSDFVPQVVDLVFEALRPDPRNRPDMNTIYQHLRTLNMQKHFHAVQDKFREVRGAEENRAPLFKPHLENLRYAQDRLETWAGTLNLCENYVSLRIDIQSESSVNVMKKLLQALREETGHHLEDRSALRSLDHLAIQSVQELLNSLPDDLLQLAENQWREKILDTAFVEQTRDSGNVPDNDLPATIMDKPLDPLKSEFEEEAQKFKSSLGDVVYLDEILKITSIEGVYDITDKIQDSQHKCGELRYLSKIKIYLERLDGYVSMINGIIHESHDVLALLWGSIAVLLQLTGSLNKAYDSLIDVLARVGRVLPDFQTSASVFNQSIETRELLIFFFKDLLKIYGSALKFFSHTNWMHLFDHLWPQQHAYYLEVASHMDRLTRLMRTNIRIEDIQKEDEFRKEASENFKTQARKSHTQRFHHLITSFSPCRYDATLYRLDGLCYDGTGNWLFADKTFKQWRNSLEEGPRILWLKGIPGAGKTVLSGAIVNRLGRIRGTKMTFAFLTYQEAKTSALSTIHSLIFQLAGDDEDLMSIVCESMDDSIKSSLKAAGNVLSSLIHYVGSVYLLIDGVDEINEVERGRLVTELLRLIKECGTLRIIFSSRPEADLMRLLDNTAAVIHIHDHNEGSIGDYVNQRIEKYFHIRNILPKAKTEIKNLLTPLASRAKGMFLYARLIMDMATDIQDLSELQKELTILPESLDAAYHRIIMRLGSHEDKRRTEKAWRLLGWVACSTAPITVEEAHQALVIAPGNREQVFDMVAKLDVVELLGPIVETVDTYIRFVHFTAKEYVSSPHLGAQLIDKTQATLDLAMRCITYLCQHHHDPRLSSEELSRKVTTGQYSFHAFAMRMWFELICQYIQLIRPADPSAEFIKSMRMLRKFRKVQGPHNTMRDESDAENENWTDNESTLEALKRKQPLLYQVLRDVSRFRNSSFLFTGRTNQGPSKDINDPLSLSDMSRRIQLAFKYTMCDSPTGWLTSGEPGCHANCANILYYYGPRPFKCSFPGCEFWRHGFQGRSSRDKHEASHDTPLKCHVAGCQYEKIGFLSEKMRENHLRDAHKGKSAQLSFNLDNVTGDRVGAILLDFVRDNQVDAVHNILDASPNAIESDKTRFELRLSATSGDMLNLLEKPDERDKQDIISKEWVDCIRESIKQHNESTLEYFLSRITPFTNGNSLSIDSYKLLISLISELVPSNWTKGTEIWSRSIRTRWILAPSRDDKLTRIRELLGRHIIIKAASRSDGGQQLIRLWRDIEIDLLGGEWASQALKDVAEHGSITLAKYLLDNGANINHRRSASYPTALQRAAKRNTETNAKMIKFLLEFGADPDADQRATKLHYLRKSRPGKKIRDEAGAKGIHEWLGKSWDELAEETKNTRKT